MLVNVSSKTGGVQEYTALGAKLEISRELSRQKEIIKSKAFGY
jgi:hypothetical protein